jgi:single-strand DNA-binding protein
MPGSYNRVILVGNLTRDPEVRQIASGASVVKFTLAVNRRTKNGDESTFIDIVAWEKLAETCGNYLKKGMSVLVEGRLVIRNYDDKDGNKRKATEVVIDVMQMLDRKGDFGGGGGDAPNASSNSGGYNKPSGGGADHYDDSAIEDEIPF